MRGVEFHFDAIGKCIAANNRITFGAFVVLSVLYWTLIVLLSLLTFVFS